MPPRRVSRKVNVMIMFINKIAAPLFTKQWPVAMLTLADSVRSTRSLFGPLFATCRRISTAASNANMREIVHNTAPSKDTSAWDERHDRRLTVSLLDIGACPYVDVVRGLSPDQYHSNYVTERVTAGAGGGVTAGVANNLCGWIPVEVMLAEAPPPQKRTRRPVPKSTGYARHKDISVGFEFYTNWRDFMNRYRHEYTYRDVNPDRYNNPDRYMGSGHRYSVRPATPPHEVEDVSPNKDVQYMSFVNTATDVPETAAKLYRKSLYVVSKPGNEYTLITTTTSSGGKQNYDGPGGIVLRPCSSKIRLDNAERRRFSRMTEDRVLKGRLQVINIDNTRKTYTDNKNNMLVRCCKYTY